MEDVFDLPLSVGKSSTRFAAGLLCGCCCCCLAGAIDGGCSVLNTDGFVPPSDGKSSLSMPPSCTEKLLDNFTLCAIVTAAAEGGGALSFAAALSLAVALASADAAVVDSLPVDDDVTAFGAYAKSSSTSESVSSLIPLISTPAGTGFSDDVFVVCTGLLLLDVRSVFRTSSKRCLDLGECLVLAAPPAAAAAAPRKSGSLAMDRKALALVCSRLGSTTLTELVVA